MCLVVSGSSNGCEHYLDLCSGQYLPLVIVCSGSLVEFGYHLRCPVSDCMKCCPFHIGQNSHAETIQGNIRLQQHPNVSPCLRFGLYIALVDVITASQSVKYDSPVGSPGGIYQGIPVREPAILRRLEYRQAAFLRVARNGRKVSIDKLRKMAQKRTEQPVLFLYESKHFTFAAYSGFQGLGKEHPVFFNDSIGTAFICRDRIQWIEKRLRFRCQLHQLRVLPVLGSLFSDQQHIRKSSRLLQSQTGKFNAQRIVQSTNFAFVIGVNTACCVFGDTSRYRIPKRLPVVDFFQSDGLLAGLLPFAPRTGMTCKHRQHF